MLLNNLKEGVFIIEEKDSKVLFQNNAAELISSRLQTKCSFDMTTKSGERTSMTLNQGQPMFEQVNIDKLYSSDFASGVEYLKSASEQESLENIIEKQLEHGPLHKRVYKVKTEFSGSSRGLVDDEREK